MIVKWAKGAKEVVMPWELNGIEVCNHLINYYLLLLNYLPLTCMKYLINY